MNKKRSFYWYCQLSGWLFYGLTIIFFSLVLDKKQNPIFYPRMGMNLMLGVLFTHALRLSFHKLNLRPPLSSQYWGRLILLILSCIVAYSFTTSYMTEILHLYDEKRKASLGTRFLFTIAFDAPILLVWTSIYFLWHYIEYTNEEALKKVKLETLIKELELKTIKSQINPHFIFNALNSIRALVDEDPSRARQAITELSNILRSSIQVDKVEHTSLAKELDIVKDYLALEYIRFADRLQIDYQIDESLKENHVPPMMIQTLVENAIKHGLSKMPGNCLIQIIVRKQDDKMEVKVVNNGQYTEDATVGGFGLQSTKERLNILFGSNAHFEIQQCETNKVAAKLLLPIYK
jgi:sensor histidine kinase YesM